MTEILSKEASVNAPQTMLLTQILFINGFYKCCILYGIHKVFRELSKVAGGDRSLCSIHS